MVEESTQAKPAAPAAQSNDNLMAALSYVSFISIVIFFVKKDSDYVSFHARQGLVLFGGEIVLWVLESITLFLFFLWGLVGLVFLIASILGFIKALSGERYSLPVIGDIASKIKI